MAGANPGVGLVLAPGSLWWGTHTPASPPPPPAAPGGPGDAAPVRGWALASLQVAGAPSEVSGGWKPIPRCRNRCQTQSLAAFWMEHIHGDLCSGATVRNKIAQSEHYTFAALGV